MEGCGVGCEVFVDVVVGLGVVVVVVVVVEVVVVVASVVVVVEVDVVVVVEDSGTGVNSGAIVSGSGLVSATYRSVLSSGGGVEVVVLVDRFWKMWLISGIDTKFRGVS